jgi:tight adherence protein C
MDTTILLSLAMVLIAGSLVLIGLSRQRTAVVNVEQRLSGYGGEVAPLEQRELAQPFSQRIVRPAIRAASRTLGKFAAKRNAEVVKQKLEAAGNPSGLGVVEFGGMRLLLALGLGGSAFLLMAASGSGATALMFGGVLAVFGYMMPGIWLDRRVKARKKEITLALPDAIDLLTISVESGLGFDPALMRVAEKWDNALTREFARTLSEMRIGKAKREALREMGERCGVDDLRVFISSVVQADQLGVSISQILRIQSEAMRLRRKQRAEEAAHKAPIKMLFPMIFLIFPAIYVVILGPAVPQIAEAFR